MEDKNNQFGLNSKVVLIFMMFFLVLGLVASLLQVPKYVSQIRFLVIKQAGADADPFAVSHSSNYVAHILGSVIHSSVYFEQVLNSGFDIDRSQFKEDPKKRERQWKKMVRPLVREDMGMIEVKVLNRDFHQTQQIANAIAFIMNTQTDVYHGVSGITVKVIDPPLTDVRPTVPNIPLNLLVSVLLGLMAGIGFAYLYPNHEFGFANRIFIKGERVLFNKSKKVFSRMAYAFKKPFGLILDRKALESKNIQIKEPVSSVPFVSRLEEDRHAREVLKPEQSCQPFSEENASKPLPNLRDHMNMSEYH